MFEKLGHKLHPYHVLYCVMGAGLLYLGFTEREIIKYAFLSSGAIIAIEIIKIYACRLWSWAVQKYKAHKQQRVQHRQFITQLSNHLAADKQKKLDHRTAVRNLLAPLNYNGKLPEDIVKLKAVLQQLHVSPNNNLFNEEFRKLLSVEQRNQVDHWFKLIKEREEIVSKLFLALDGQYGDLRRSISDALQGKMWNDPGGDTEHVRSQDYDVRGDIIRMINSVLFMVQWKHASCTHTWNDHGLIYHYSPQCFGLVNYPIENHCSGELLFGVSADLGKFVFDFFEKPLSAFCRANL